MDSAWIAMVMGILILTVSAGIIIVTPCLQPWFFPRYGDRVIELADQSDAELHCISVESWEAPLRTLAASRPAACSS